MKAILVDGIHDYNYSVEKTEVGKIHLLFRSSGEQWTNKNEEILSITDTGDGFIFNHSKPNKRMDYGYAFELSILLKIISFNESVNKPNEDCNFSMPVPCNDFELSFKSSNLSCSSLACWVSSLNPSTSIFLPVVQQFYPPGTA